MFQDFYEGKLSLYTGSTVRKLIGLPGDADKFLGVNFSKKHFNGLRNKMLYLFYV
jgi:hypothetical protein